MVGLKCALWLTVVIVSCGGEETSRADNGVGHLPVYLPEPLRMIAEKAAKGEEIKADDLPQELHELLADIEAVCELDRNVHQLQASGTPSGMPSGMPSRTGRGLLTSLHWLTNSPFAFYTGSGTLSSTQSLTILGRIINSALRLDYGPVRSQGATTMMPEGRQ
ncbi:uncharacterized protein LOC111050896 [Nilaparvata lugens]|uniref:uncharacterized protein LOC111050896 n=1 Tax=Nilaparvata lugens TaxID=108931 RepID=UPI00193D5A7E|nr:uncharacterized protein LOC111050896 [Nilaparvata lugens]